MSSAPATPAGPSSSGISMPTLVSNPRRSMLRALVGHWGIRTDEDLEVIADDVDELAHIHGRRYWPSTGPIT
jgi:hypothetical protein